MKELIGSEIKNNNDLYQGITINKDSIDIHIKDYNLISYNGENKLFYDDTIDEIYNMNIEDMSLKITKRNLYNQDIILFIEGKHTNNKSIKIDIDTVIKSFSFEQEYKKPLYDNRYGENKLSGPSYYIDFIEGSAMVSKIYYYRELIKEYEDGNSYILELIKESNEIKIIDDQIICEIEPEKECFSLAIIISKNKLFTNKNRMNEYIEFYFDSVFNNSVWCSFFIRPSGTYTKLPYSIEPFTKDGYGFSLHHSSKRELLPFLHETKERFYYDLLENAILQAYMYQKNENGVFYSGYTSTWVKNETGITSPYIDTRLNETFLMTVNEFLPYTPIKSKLEPIINFVDYLYKYSKLEKELYVRGSGFLFPDYFTDKVIKLSHTSLNHQLALANLSYKAYQLYNNKNYLEIYNGIINFIENTKDEWINQANGDLYYGLKLDKNDEMIYFGTDYVYITLIDLLYMQKAYKELNNGRFNEAIRFLTVIRLNYLRETEYDLMGENLYPVSGEPINSVDEVIKLLDDIYGTNDEIISIVYSLDGFKYNTLDRLSEIETISNVLLKCKAYQVKNEKRKQHELSNKLEKTSVELQGIIEQLTDSNKKIEDLHEEIQQYKAKLKNEQDKNVELKQDLDKEVEQAVILLEKLKKRTSNFEYEQKKANQLKQKCQEYEYRFNQYSESKWFKLMIFDWKLKSKLKFYIKKNIYKMSHWLYIKLMPHPKLKAICSKINQKLGIFKDTQKVICWQSKNNTVPSCDKRDEKILKQVKDINVAMIADQFTYNSFKYECNALPIEPNNWREVFQNNRIDIFFCESAWAGIDSVRRPWRGKVYCSTNFKKENRVELLEIIKYCKENNIPTVFWNKEDPTHYPDRIHDFVNTAIKFDHIFTTDKSCVERYKKDYGHKSVHLLMFATQPKLFNPIEKFNRSKEIIFAGSWYNQHPTRCREMGEILDNIIESNYSLKIYDRHSGTDDTNHHFPNRFKEYLNPALPHDQMEIAYKSSEYALNINTVTESDTMFARRVFELMSSNTLVLSNYSKGMEELFGDNVIFVDGTKELVLHDTEKKRSKALYNVLRYHTYKQRFKQILNNIEFKYEDEKEYVTIIFSVKSFSQAKKLYSVFEEIEYEYKNLIFYVLESCSGADLREITIRYNSSLATVISQSYCKKYKDIFNISSKYFVVADDKLKSDFISKAIVHFEYLESNIGVTVGEDKYTFTQGICLNNILFSNENFEIIKSQINFNTKNEFGIYII